MPGLPLVPSGDLRQADVTAVVRADITDAARQDDGTGRLVDPDAEERLDDCPERCPLRTPVYYDLTGDGTLDLITALDIDDRHSELRVYTLREHTIVRILSLRAALANVSVIPGGIQVTEPVTAKGIRHTTAFQWDGHRLLRSQAWDEYAEPRDDKK